VIGSGAVPGFGSLPSIRLYLPYSSVLQNVSLVNQEMRHGATRPRMESPNKDWRSSHESPVSDWARRWYDAFSIENASLISPPSLI